MARILIVDDNEDNRTMLSRRLVRRGMHVEVAEDGPSALEAIEAGEFDLILLDVMMPGMSGTEVLRVIRSSRDKLELPVIMATAKSESDDVVEALTLGANDYVTKPIDFPVLLARLKSHLAARESFAARAAAPDTSTLDYVGPGTVLHGRYRLSRRIGVGGFAVVYEARQLSTGQAVAVKMLHEDFIDEVQLARFELEMQIIGQLRHPHVVRLIDCGHVRSVASVKRGPTATPTMPAKRNPKSTEDEAFPVPYLVMELLQGEPLSSRIERDGALSTEDTIDLLLPVASAVAAAHANQVVHRDLKPANIFLSRGVGARLHPVVLDFGIAKPAKTDRQLTMAKSLVGTPQYMAPEQVRGSEQLDGRTDQYAFGVMLYEALSGETPFAGLTFFQTVHAVVQGDYKAPAEAIEGLDPDLAQLIERTLNAAPEQRFESMNELGEALLPHASESARAQWEGAFEDVGPDAMAITNMDMPAMSAPTIESRVPGSAVITRDRGEGGAQPAAPGEAAEERDIAAAEGDS